MTRGESQQALRFLSEATGQQALRFVRKGAGMNTGFVGWGDRISHTLSSLRAVADGAAIQREDRVRESKGSIANGIFSFLLHGFMIVTARCFWFASSPSAHRNDEGGDANSPCAF